MTEIDPHTPLDPRDQEVLRTLVAIGAQLTDREALHLTGLIERGEYRTAEDVIAAVIDDRQHPAEAKEPTP